MWRSFFIALGITAIIMGAECLAIEKAILVAPSAANTGNSVNSGQRLPGKEYAPPEWVPWGLLSSGAVVVLYSFMLPKRVASAK